MAGKKKQDRIFLPGEHSRKKWWQVIYLPYDWIHLTKASYFHSPRITRINTNDLYPSPAPATYFHFGS
jgi:hypothetical protein